MDCVAVKLLHPDGFVEDHFEDGGKFGVEVNIYMPEDDNATASSSGEGSANTLKLKCLIKPPLKMPSTLAGWTPDMEKLHYTIHSSKTVEDLMVLCEQQFARLCQEAGRARANINSISGPCGEQISVRSPWRSTRSWRSIFTTGILSVFRPSCAETRTMKSRATSQINLSSLERRAGSALWSLMFCLAWRAKQRRGQDF